MVAIGENRSLQISLPPSRVQATLAKISKHPINRPFNASNGTRVAPCQQAPESHPVIGPPLPPATFPCTKCSIDVPRGAVRDGTLLVTGGNNCTTAAPNREARPQGLPLLLSTAVSRAIDVSRTAF